MQATENIDALRASVRMSWHVKDGRQPLSLAELEEKLKEMVAKGWGVSRIAHDLGVSNPTARRYLKKHGLKTIWQQA